MARTRQSGGHLRREPSTDLGRELTEAQDCNFRYKKAAAAAAKSSQSCPTLCDLIDGSPPGSPVPGIGDLNRICTQNNCTPFPQSECLGAGHLQIQVSQPEGRVGLIIRGKLSAKSNCTPQCCFFFNCLSFYKHITKDPRHLKKICQKRPQDK